MTDAAASTDPVGAAAWLDADAVDAAPGRPWAVAWSGRVDAALTVLLDEFTAGVGSSPGGIALVALGSYARRTLCPKSDVDLLLLHDGWGTRDLEALVQAVCYPLWDAGLSVGHAVRTSRDAVRAAGERIDSATAITERRLVAGTAGLADDLSGKVARWVRKGSARLAADIAAADLERHRRHGGSTGALEPELKDGIGGLRDLHSLRWAGAVLLGEPGLDPLVGARYLSAPDRADLAQAEDVLLAARCALHLVADRSARDRLRLDLQDEVALALGMADGDVLLRAVGLATRTISHLHSRTWPVLLEDATSGRRRRAQPPERLGPDLVRASGLVEVDPAARLADQPALALRAAAAAGRAGTVIGRHSAGRLRREAEAIGALAWDDDARDALRSLLRSGPAGMPAMGDADNLGILSAHLPEWDLVRGRPQRNPLHTFDLDTHGLQASAWLEEVRAGGLDPHHAALAGGIGDPDALLLGTWLHDVGKAWPGDHSVVGEVVAVRWVRHMGFDDATADRVGRLVRLHLLLPDVATTRDLDNPDEIDRVAEAVGDVELLDGLYLLSFADSRATGRAAWSVWKDLLVTKLHARVRAALGGAVARPPAADVSEEAIRIAAQDDDVEVRQVRTTVDGLPDRYLDAASPEQLATHARLLHEPVEGLAVDVRRGPAEGLEVVSLAGPDRRGMVADCLGVLAARRIDVHEARIFTHADGTALDWFVVRTAPPEVWDDTVRDLRLAYAGTLAVEAAVERRERERDARPPALATPVPVVVETAPSGRLTRLEVRGPDGPGVLYRLTLALSRLDASLLGARIATLGPEVRDTFFLSGALPPIGELRDVLSAAFPDPPAAP